MFYPVLIVGFVILVFMLATKDILQIISILLNVDICQIVGLFILITLFLISRFNLLKNLDILFGRIT
jgi:hypothetical protein